MFASLACRLPAASRQQPQCHEVRARLLTAIEPLQHLHAFTRVRRRSQVRMREQPDSARTLDHADGLCVDSDAMMAASLLRKTGCVLKGFAAALVVAAVAESCLPPGQE
jgi:hypothetical protein